MTKKDAAKLVMIVVTAYPNFDKFRDEDSVNATVNLWAVMLEDIDAATADLAVRQHIATSKWPPSIAELRERILEITRPDVVPPDKAWLAVSDLLYSVGEHNYCDLAKQLPPLVSRAVEAIGWGNLWEMHRSCYVGGKPGMDRIAFLQQYEPMYQREKEKAMTPEPVARQIEATTAKSPEKGQKFLEACEKERIQRKHYFQGIENRQKSLPEAIEGLADISDEEKSQKSPEDLEKERIERIQRERYYQALENSHRAFPEVVETAANAFSELSKSARKKGLVEIV